MQSLLRPTWLEIDATALRNNVHQIRRLIGTNCELMAVVKANAYGHSAPLTAPILLEAGADRLAVATIGEAIELRQHGIVAPILVTGYTPAWLANQLVTSAITATIFDLETAAALDQAAASHSCRATVHVKVNTGMNRLGVQPATAVEFLSKLRQFQHLHIEGIFTHFATSDELDKWYAWEQFARFTAVLDQAQAAGLRPPLAHAANSAAVLTMPATHLDMVRCGIALYGLHPDAEATRLPAEFRPALQWKAQVAQVLSLAPGESVSYGREFIAQQPMQVAVIPVGYADGFPRRPYHWGHVLIHGQPAPLLGRICMDQTIVDVTALVAAGRVVRQGDEVVLLGKQADAAISAEEAADQLRTNNYDVISRILGRVPRILTHACDELSAKQESSWEQQP